MNSALAALVSPLALVRLSGRAWLYLLAYLAAAAGLLFATRVLLVAHEHALEQLLLDYLFPESWHFAAELVLRRFFAEQEKVVVINLIIATALMVVTVSLFWLKELVSAAFEKDAGLCDEPVREHPLWEQAWQEIKLLLLFFAVQGSIFWIGYQPSVFFAKLSIALSYLFLFFTFAIDFISPIFQRHRGHYSRILKVLARNLPASLLFGAIFALPVVIAGKVWAAGHPWSWDRALAILFGLNVLTVAWACVAGTWLGARMMDDFRTTERSGVLTRLVATAVLVALVAGNAYAFGALGRSLHRKSQILKCEYDVVWSSFGFERPSLSALLEDRIELGLHIDVVMKNPTAHDVELEDNRLEIRHRDELVATTSLQQVAVPAGETRRQTIGFDMEVTPSMVRRGRELLDASAWKMVLYLRVAPGFEFPIYLFGYGAGDGAGDGGAETETGKLIPRIDPFGAFRKGDD